MKKNLVAVETDPMSFTSIDGLWKCPVCGGHPDPNSGYREADSLKIIDYYDCKDCGRRIGVIYEVTGIEAYEEENK